MRIYLSNDASDVSGYKVAYVDMRSPNTTALTLSTTTTTGSGDDIQCTATAGGTALKWITAPFGSAKTLVTQVFCNLWCKETSAAANCGPSIELYPYSASTEGSVFLDDDALQTEITTSFAAVRWMTVAATTTDFAVGDRLVIKVYVSNVGLTMGAVTGGFLFDYDGPTDNADGDSWIDIQEDFRVNKKQYGASTNLTVPGISTGKLQSMITALNDGVTMGYFPMNCTIRKAIDQLQFEQNTLSPRNSQTIPT